MARSKKEIKKLITDEFISKPEIIAKYGLTPGNTFEQEFSLVSLENIIFDIIAFFMMVHEQIVSLNAANTRPQNIPNYKAMVMSYLDGLPIIWKDGQYQFDTTGVTDVEALKIIKRCAVISTSSGILVKIAGASGPLTNDQATAVLYYIDKNTQPGVRVTLVNKDADNLKADIDVYVDPLVIDLATGKLKNATEDTFPVLEAIDNYLANLEFNGAFVRNKFEAQLEAAAGVKLIDITLLQWKYESLPFGDAGIYRISNSGSFKFDPADLTINYKSYGILE